MDLTTEAAPLLNPQRLWTRAEVMAAPCPVPAQAGVYAWYFKHVPPGVPTNGCVTSHGATLLYVGISPGRPPSNGRPESKESLRKRIRYHYNGNAEGSTLRLTLGCLLRSELETELRRVGSGTRFTFAHREAALSDWMTENAFVVWLPTTRQCEIEEALIASIALPLNLDQNRHHPFHSTLSLCRREARARAKDLPVWSPA